MLWKRTKNFKILRPFILSSNIRFVIINIYFFVFLIKFRKTKQIVVALVATALKALLSVTKTALRISGRKLYVGNIYYFFYIFAHISSVCK